MAAPTKAPAPSGPFPRSSRASSMLLRLSSLALVLLPAFSLAAAAAETDTTGLAHTASLETAGTGVALTAVETVTSQEASKLGAVKHRTAGQQAAKQSAAKQEASLHEAGKHAAAITRLRRPGRFEHAKTARWLVASNTWGVVSTTSIHLRGAPFGNIASFSDLLGSTITGTPYFYLTTLDPTAADAERSPVCSFTLSEAPLGTCGSIDPENPLCAKITLAGHLEKVANSTEKGMALQGLFAKHAEMEQWPADHGFAVYALRVSSIFLIDFFGGAKPLTVEEYYSVLPPFDRKYEGLARNE